MKSKFGDIMDSAKLSRVHLGTVLTPSPPKRGEGWGEGI
jgi:hypothetical protein